MSTFGLVSQRGRYSPLWTRIFLILLVTAAALGAGASQAAFADPADEMGKWQNVVDKFTAKISQVPGAQLAGDDAQVQTLIRQAYYETYQVSGLEDKIKHTLGRDVNDEFVQMLLSLRNLGREGATEVQMQNASNNVVSQLRENVSSLLAAPEISDQWTRVAQDIAQAVNSAQAAYLKGDSQTAFKLATDAYLAHYEADGLENTTIVHRGFERATEVEALFRDLRQGYKDELDAQHLAKVGQALIAAVEQDAALLDQKSSGDSEPLGWSGFFASFLILLREGGEALLVVSALVTYSLKAGRRDQLRAILLGVGIAIVFSVALSVVFGQLTASASTGFGQEVIEGITGIAAALMLIYVSNWILNKSHGQRWENYIRAAAHQEGPLGGGLALAFVSFLTVAREGAETILFFAPIVSSAKTTTDFWLIALGGIGASVVLIILFLLVWLFGIRLPLKAFFRWTSILLGILALTIIGGAINELQEAALIGSRVIPGVPTIVFLGLYPTLQTLGAQLITAVVLVALAVLQLSKSRKPTGEEISSADLPQQVVAQK